MSLASLVAPIATAAISAGASSLFGGKDKKVAAAPPPNPFGMPQVTSALANLSNPKTMLKDFTGGGLTGAYDANGNTSVSSDPTRAALVNGLSNTYGMQLSRLNELAAQIAPGASQLRAAQLADINNRGTAAVSNLRDNLNARRVLGSSFGQDAINRTNATYASERATTIAQTYQQELDATHQLINEQSAAGAAQFQQHLTESNLQAGIAGQLHTEGTQAMADAAKVQAQVTASLANQYSASSTNTNIKNADLDAEAQKGAGSYWTTLLGPTANAAGSQVQSLFTPKTVAA